MCRFAAKVITRWGDKSDKAYQLYLEETKKCRPPLNEQEIQFIWRDTVKFYREKISNSPDYVSPEIFSVQGSRIKPSDFTDLGQAYVFYREYGDITAYSVATFYLYFDGKVWIESEPKVHGLVQELTDRQLDEAVSELKKAQYYENKAAVNHDSGSKRDNENRSAVAKKYRDYVLRYRDTRRISAVLREVQPMLDIDVALLDNNGFILNTPYGEIDLIVRDGGYIAFVEVKTRRAGSLVRPAEAVDRRKQKRIIQSAVYYLMEHPADLQPRFDVFEIVTEKGKIFSAQSYQYIINAYEVTNYESV